MGDASNSQLEDLPALACREVVEIITSYLEGRLSPEDTFRFERHISRCPNCSVYLSQMRATIEAAGKIDEGDLSAERKEELLGLFRDWRKAS
jgi:anti-sigma factor RsiW